MESWCDVKFRGIMGSGRDDTKEIEILGRTLRRTNKGLELEATALFAPSLWRIVLSASSCPAVMSFASSRPSFQCWPRSRTPSQWASPESWAPPVQVVAPFLLTLARLWLLQLRQRPQYLQQCPRPVMRWRPLCCAPRLSGPPLLGRAHVLALLRRCQNVLHGHRVAAPVLPLACAVQLLLRSRDWSRAWPPRVAHRSRLPSCASHASLALSTLPQLVRSLPPTFLDPLHPALRPPRPLVPRSPRPTPMTNGTHSLTHTASPHLLVAPRPPSPSRLTPLELVGVLATSVAASAQSRQALHVEGYLVCSFCRFVCFLFGVATLVGSLWARACFRGSCRFAGPCSLPLWHLGLRVLRGVTGAGPGLAFRSTSLKTLRSSTYVAQLPLARFREIGFFLVATLSGEASSQVQDLLLLDVSLSLAHGCGDCRWCHDEAH